MFVKSTFSVLWESFIHKNVSKGEKENLAEWILAVRNQLSGDMLEWTPHSPETI